MNTEKKIDPIENVWDGIGFSQMHRSEAQALVDEDKIQILPGCFSGNELKWRDEFTGYDTAEEVRDSQSLIGDNTESSKPTETDEQQQKKAEADDEKQKHSEEFKAELKEIAADQKSKTEVAQEEAREKAAVEKTEKADKRQKIDAENWRSFRAEVAEELEIDIRKVTMKQVQEHYGE